MNVLIQDLHEKFLPAMLKNGLSYWKKDMFEIIEDSSSVLKASIFGTDEYHTQIEFSGNLVVDVNCTCPYNKGVFCKHVAVLYYEKVKEELGLKKTIPRKPRSSKDVKKNSVSSNSDILTQIEMLSHEELKKIVVSKAEIDKDFEEYLIHCFALNDQDFDGLYKTTKDRIKSILKKHTKRGNYIDYSSSNLIGKLVVEISNNANELFEKGNFMLVFGISKAVIETMIKPLFYTDTSSGLFYQGLDECIDLLAKMSDEQLKKTDKDKIITFLLKEASNTAIYGFDYEVALLEIAIKFSDKGYKDKIINCIECQKKQSSDESSLSLINYEVVLKFEGEDKANELLKQRIVLPEYRAILLQKLIQSRKYDEANKLLLEGIEVNKEYRGIVLDWKVKLLEIALVTKEKKDIVAISKEMFLQYGFLTKRDLDFYEILKNQLKEEEWKKESEGLLTEIKQSDVLKEFFYREERYEELMQTLSNGTNGFYPVIDFNLKYLDVLLPDFEKEIKEVFIKNADNYLKNNSGTTTHSKVCEIIVDLKKRGVEVEDLKVYFLEKYYNRPSFKTVIKDFFG